MAIMQRRITIPFIALSLLLGPRASPAQGIQLWQQTLSHTASSSDTARSVVVDAQGNVIAAGTTTSNAFDSSDWIVAKFAPDGTLLWQRTVNGTANGSDDAASVAVDTDGSVLVAGVTTNTGTGNDFTVVKFDRDGTLLWLRSVDRGSSDAARSVAVDIQGNVLVAGVTATIDTGRNFTVAKFDRDGTSLWLRILSGCVFCSPRGGPNDLAKSVAVDTDGNVLAAGVTANPSTGAHFTVVKFAPDGTLLWQQRLNDTVLTHDEASMVVTDLAGNVFAAGYTRNIPVPDFTVVKFAPDGTLLWQQTLDITANTSDELATSVAVDTEGNVFAAGYSSTLGSFSDFVVAKFDGDGALLWLRTINGTANGSDNAASVAVDTEGNVLVAGGMTNTDTSSDFMVAKFDGDGTLLWLRTINGTANGGDRALAIAVDLDGNAVAAGVTTNTGTGSDFTVVKFASGSPPREWTFCAPEGGVCAFTGTTEVRYGADGTYTYQIFTDGTACNNTVFGDPVFGTRKSCAITIPPASTEWTVCATEGGVCAFTGAMEVRYGADGTYAYRTLTDGTACINDVFGDPVYGTVKACAIRIPPAPTEWTLCAVEGGVCTFTGIAEVRYGANGVYVYQTLLDGTACSNEVFGDPIYGVVKSCDLRTGSPSPPQP